MSQRERPRAYEAEVPTMDRIVVKDMDGLRRLLEDVRVMEPVYAHFVQKPVTSARVNMYEHEGGARVGDERYWIYVTVTNPHTTYDIALWKLLRYIDRHPSVRSRLLELIEVR